VLTKAGFKIEAESKILANPAATTRRVCAILVAGHTDQSCFGAQPAELDRIEGRAGPAMPAPSFLIRRSATEPREIEPCIANPHPTGKVAMLIRRPARDVYRAFIEPEI